MQITGRPASFSSWNSQFDSCPLSSPIRTAWGACCFTADAMASGVDSVRPRHTILPTSSMTQIDVSFSDTSRPAYCLLWDMVSLLWRCGEASLYRQSLPRDYAMSRPARGCGRRAGRRWRAAGARDAPAGGRPEGLVFAGREHGGRLVCVGIGRVTLVVIRGEIPDRGMTTARVVEALDRSEAR